MIMAGPGPPGWGHLRVQRGGQDELPARGAAISTHIYTYLDISTCYLHLHIIYVSPQVAAAGVKNMEMEALVFGALTHMAGVRSAVVCVTLLDRLKGDQVATESINIAQL